MTDAQFLWHISVNILVAIGTLGSVIVALFGQWLRLKLWPPKIRMSLVSALGEKTLENSPDGKLEVRYYHLHVENDRPWSPATSACVEFVRLEEPGPDETYQVTWFGRVPIRRRHQEMYQLTTDIGSPVDYDVCRVSSGRSPTLKLMPIIVPNNLKIQYVGSRRLRLFLQVNSLQNVQTALLVEIAWDGQWDDGDAEMAKHFKIKVLRHAG